VRWSTSELTAHLSGAELVGPDVSIEGASIDSRTIRAGQLYVPIVAETVDPFYWASGDLPLDPRSTGFQEAA
jgi:UDP-N-acetylmuramyl pentapeptide synthase